MTDGPDAIVVTDTTAIVAHEAVDHMIRYKDQYNHAMSEDALERARDDLSNRLDRDE